MWKTVFCVTHNSYLTHGMLNEFPFNNKYQSMGFLKMITSIPSTFNLIDVPEERE